MCRNIRPLFNFEPPATADEVHDAAVQYVRKISGFSKPSAANAEAFERAVAAIEEASGRLLDELVTNAPHKNREVEADEGARPPRRAGSRVARSPAGPPESDRRAIDSRRRAAMVASMSVPAATEDALALEVGCTFELDAAFAIAAIVQVAPGPDPGLLLQRETWDTAAGHHGYVDLYGNRCERFEIAAGRSRIAYEARLLLSHPADVIDPDARETPVAELPDDDDRVHDAEPLLPARRARPRGVAALRRARARLGAGAGDRRLRPRAPRVGVGGVEPVDDRRRRVPLGPGRLPRLRPPRDHVLPRAEHPGALRLRLHPGDRLRAADRADGLRRVVRGLDRRALAHLRRAQQRAAHGPGRRRPRARRRRRRADHVVRPADADGLRGPRPAAGAGRRRLRRTATPSWRSAACVTAFTRRPAARRRGRSRCRAATPRR